jgi:drug/metabolite transporter (DMT)-like permease
MQRFSSPIIGFFETLAAFALGGSTVIAAGFLTTQLPVFTASLISMAAGLILLIPLQWRRREELKNLNAWDVLFISFQGLTGMLLFRVFTLLGLRHTTAFSAGIITSTSPAVMMLLAIILLRERPSRQLLGAAFLAIAGLIIINFKKGGEAAADLSGNLLIFLAVLCECGMTLIRKARKKKIPTLTNTTVLVICSIVLSLPEALFEMRTFSLSQIQMRDWMILLYYGLFPTAAGYLLWADGVVRIPGSLTGICMTAAPVTVFILSITLLHESVDFVQVLGGGLALLAIILSHIRLPFREQRVYSNSFPIRKPSFPKDDIPE